MWRVVWNAVIEDYRNVHHTHLEQEEAQLQAPFPSGYSGSQIFPQEAVKDFSAGKKKKTL